MGLKPDQFKGGLYRGSDRDRLVAGIGLTDAEQAAQLKRELAVSDRVVALDLLATLTIGIAAAYAVAAGHTAFLDAAVILALVAFLGTVAFSYYLSWREPSCSMR